MVARSMGGDAGRDIRIITDDTTPPARQTAPVFKTRAGVPMQASCVQDEIEEMFARIDEDGDRSISFAEYARLMREMDRASPDAALRGGFDAIDTDRDGRVSFDEFRAWISR
jgi:hypothetical protein